MPGWHGVIITTDVLRAMIDPSCLKHIKPRLPLCLLDCVSSKVLLSAVGLMIRRRHPELVPQAPTSLRPRLPKTDQQHDICLRSPPLPPPHLLSFTQNRPVGIGSKQNVRSPVQIQCRHELRWLLGGRGTSSQETGWYVPRPSSSHPFPRPSGFPSVWLCVMIGTTLPFTPHLIHHNVQVSNRST